MTSVCWFGVSGKAYHMELCPLGSAFDSVPGVYVFCKPGTGSAWTPIYVGECRDLEQCLNTNLTSHNKWSAIAHSGATSVCVIRIDGSKDNCRVAGNDLRRAYDPPCNRRLAPILKH
jgi:hypothetical protein